MLDLGRDLVSFKALPFSKILLGAIMRGVVVAPQPEAVEAGIRVLRNGGNAVDAAITAGFVQTVVDFQMCGIGGLGTVLVYIRKSNKVYNISFYEKAPYTAHPKMYKPLRLTDQKDGLYIVRNLENQVGYKAVATPGTLWGFYEALCRFGTLSWKDAMEPAIRFAKEGIQISQEQFDIWHRKWREGDVDNRTKLNATRECSKIYTKRGGPFSVGDVVVNEGMARTYSELAKGGIDVFYRGKIAKKIVEDFRENGGFLTEKDFDEYAGSVESPISCKFKGYTVFANNPPGSGVVLLEMLKIIESSDLSGIDQNSPEYISLIAQIMRLGFQDKVKFLGDPKFVEVPVRKLISKEYTQNRARLVRKGEIPRSLYGNPRDVPPHTTHICVVDSDGNLVSLTHTLGMSSGVITEGLGFLYNNAMHKFNPISGYPDSIAPGKSRASSLSPIIIFKGHKPFMVLGAQGGNGIISGNLQVILNVIIHGTSILEAVSLPRFHCEDQEIKLEKRFSEDICRRLTKKGFRVTRTPYSYDIFAGIVQAVFLDDKKGWQGASDPRAGGVALYT